MTGKYLVGAGKNSSLPCPKYPSPYVPLFSSQLSTNNITLQAENFISKPYFEADEKSHGNDGAIHAAPSEIALISKFLLEAFQSRGTPLIPDMFSTGEKSHGYGYAVRSVKDGVCSTAANDVLNDNVRSRITIKTNTLVDKVLFEMNDEGRRASGVKVIMENGRKVIFKARKEVIVSAGPYCSPAILLRSGIGCNKEVEELGIQSIIDLPGFGKNLMDHLVSSPFYTSLK
jgi:choline dehydrogenase-like flavoprotein